MKSLILFILMFCCQFILAQSSEYKSESTFKRDSTNISSYSSVKNISDSTLVASQTKRIENKKYFFETKKDTEKPVATQNIDVVQEINAVLNYKINRIWRQDLYCLVCENFDPGLAA